MLLKSARLDARSRLDQNLERVGGSCAAERVIGIDDLR
jgi:hypothetical protein